ncbi:sensor domain-containing protein [Paraburkholderia caballeronis]|uniref:sensor domain-containing protein n=1 Tax=Paraburkholderia caballeronis TaxID=416943 RepID=UPI001065A8A8|nr:EAL domain-containing protein [Paraburkholderia caballeronis]TDV09916.1 PAS domain S-box-containing protein/diguanylate cyclase (GGDEF)-like protein [Paraburkholderia caballeronis]TDV14160.1 PAS domain S-box-containing protein/diguanylate cyclase (GGDEF)-like protein [Paraburkholderia caballeronis]TDV23214.1 PAS domain S-box-containing protein/diguanylate cyclase (GGDEF)-like protein [Paraburkholderia caballeronis]
MNRRRGTGLGEGSELTPADRRKASALFGSARVQIVTAIAVLCILAAIGLNTALALWQTREQNNALGQQRSVALIKHNLDELQQALLDEHEQLYTVIGTRPFYRRAAYIFPLPALIDYTTSAQHACGSDERCIGLLEELKDMIRHLGRLSNDLAMRSMLKPGSVTVSAPALGEIDARFFQTMGKIVEIRIGADADLDSSVSRASLDAKRVSYFLLGSGLAAAVMLLMLLTRNARIMKTLRVALRTANSNRAKYQRLFLQNPLPIWIVDDETGCIVAVNESAVKAFGYGEAELLTMRLGALRSEERPQLLDPALEARTLSDDGAVGVWDHRTKSGARLSMIVHHLHTDFDGRRATMCVMLDITGQLTAQAELFRSMQMLEHVLDHIPQGIAWKDSSHRYVGGNEIYARDAGLASRRELAGLTDADLRWGDDPDAVRAEDVEVMAGALVKEHVERAAIAVDGSTVWISETKLPLVDPSGTGVGVLTAYDNITSRRKSELALRLQARALDASINGIVIAEADDGRHPITYVNRAFERMTGLASAAVVGRDFGSLFGDGDAESWSGVRDALKSGIDANVTLKCDRTDGTTFWNHVLVAPVPDPGGTVTHHVGVMSDVTDVVAYQARLKHQARYDSLTGLPNRTLLDERLVAAIQRAASTGDHVYVLFLDLDHFKEVNDSLGHRVGDALLTQIAGRVSVVIEPSDTIARYGGDEFIVVLERRRGAPVTSLLEGLLAVMAAPARVGEHELFIEASIGVSTYPGDGADADTLIRNADAAMYLAKASGRNQYQFYRPELSESAAARLRMSTRLRVALRDGALTVMYQPQYDMSTGRVVGAEALLRWHDAELGHVSPAVFIPVAEDTGLIRGIGEWVLRKACAQGAEWNCGPRSAVRISVNVSPLQFEHSDLPAVVADALTESGLAPEMLELEVTEGALMRNADHAAGVLAQLREMGVRIAIDDFGTGYSSLSHLKRFPVDRIKIDRAFIKEIGADSETEAITLAVIAMARALRFDVIAEGVETETHRRFLLDHGCVEAQGFLYSPAVRGDALEALIEGAEMTKG